MASISASIASRSRASASARVLAEGTSSIPIVAIERMGQKGVDCFPMCRLFACRWGSLVGIDDEYSLPSTGFSDKGEG
jgi:hypothetical protein